jgi:hypothetical protein
MLLENLSSDNTFSDAYGEECVGMAGGEPKLMASQM